jgi:hypothetical protein
MAKKKNADMIKFLDEKITAAEKAILTHNGQSLSDFDKLFRYLKLRDYYDESKEVLL